MRFIYEYRTSDNIRHEDVVVASNKDAAYRVLRERGIRPCRVSSAPGIINKLIGIGKWWFFFVLLAVTLAVMIYSYSRLNTDDDSNQAATFPLMRRQVYGDPALMEHLVRTGFADVFDCQADRFLACYAQPATEWKFPPSLSTLLDKQRIIGESLGRLVAADFKPDIAISSEDPREIVEIKRIVLWMRCELRDYLANGIGTPESYVRRLEQRQHEEQVIYGRIKNELSRTSDADAWERGNDQLRAIGAPTLVRKGKEIVGEDVNLKW